MGNFRHNIGVLADGVGQLIVSRRSAKAVNVADYLPYIYCVGFFKSGAMASYSVLFANQET